MFIAYQARDEFQMLGEAFEILGMQAKRDYYDKGYDAQGIRECLQVRKRFGGQAPCASCGEDEAGKAGSDGRWFCNVCWDRFYREHPEDAGGHPGHPGGFPGAPASASASSPGARPPAGTAAPSAGAPPRTGAPEAGTAAPSAPAWPEGVPLPRWGDVLGMGVADLKGVLKQMQVDPGGCLTKADLRVCIRERLDLLSPAESTSVSTAAETGTNPASTPSSDTEPILSPWGVRSSVPAPPAPSRPTIGAAGACASGCEATGAGSVGEGGQGSWDLPSEVLVHRQYSHGWS